jgi:Do/DeqQ family serine protease
MNAASRLPLVLTVAVGVVLGLFAARALDLQRVAAQEGAVRREAEAAALAARYPAAAANLEVFSLAAKVASPSVVHITRKVGGEYYRDWFGGVVRTPESEAVGSGVVVSADGHILTNNHVVEGAKELVVHFVEGASVKARVVGTDPETDLAVVKILTPRDIVPARLGDSDKLTVGEWVLAIGSPFGLDHTVTSGIVSAKGRKRGLLALEDFIQTDAAINPGNSGGALVNLKGEVVGINSAIVTETGNYSGVGFAIPINMARRVMDNLIAKGRVVRGFLGVEVRNIDEALAERYSLENVAALLKELKLDAPKGAFVAGFTRTEAGSPAEKAGLKEGDVITVFDGRTVAGVEDLILRIMQTVPGTRVDVKVWRAGKEQSLSVAVGERPDAEAAAKGRRVPRRR